MRIQQAAKAAGFVEMYQAAAEVARSQLGRISGWATVQGNCGCEFGDIEYAESRSRFIAGNAIKRRSDEPFFGVEKLLPSGG
jgi:hypothetical protein